MYEPQTSQIIDKIQLINYRDEGLSAAREELEISHEVLESQKLLINQLERELVETRQELETVNEELAKTLMLGVGFEEAQAIAKTIFKEKDGCSQLVSKLLNILYGVSVETQEPEEKTYRAWVAC
ncbi:hypothetical protein DSM106972_086210 [Dulcicalothrix desertica PCC 7102]|uniref:ANTAR domain-containing protein n=1 Tax=Dulcicalothrix desertica PCC 7102 TaxID=232991 RepID=A0A3S1C792_9CYAN|nr:hypothetical protein [Dulcicalothrix desertica]RUS96598.1 hypothetical protein DSM106972_086210 [Dulcicalothrix desertica PCC 7102]TWH43850.1 hypothetical protein CAL7102_07598 [Dulcicalothrix desertica PCC 7102]